jgi:hypothetical protein
MVFSTLVFTPLQVIASEYANILAQNPVNHLQLIVNNLNMLVINKQDELFKNETTEEEQKEIKPRFLKYSLTKDNKLLINMFYEATVVNLTKAKCQETLDEEYTKMRQPESAFSKILSMVSFYEISSEQVGEMLNESIINVVIVANENKELTTSCSK